MTNRQTVITEMEKGSTPETGLWLAGRKFRTLVLAVKNLRFPMGTLRSKAYKWGYIVTKMASISTMLESGSSSKWKFLSPLQYGPKLKWDNWG